VTKIYIIAGKKFDTQKDAIRFIRSILNKYNLNGKLTKEDFNFISELLKRHSDNKEKVGCGIKEFRVRKNKKWANTRCFYIIRTDGSVEDFSYRSCLKNN